MKPIVRNTLIALTVGVVLFGFYVKDTVETAIDVFAKIKIKPYSFPKALKFYDYNSVYIPQKFSFDIDVIISNPAFQEFSVSGFGVATLKTISVFWKDYHIGTANLELDEITVPAQSSFILKDVHFEGNTLPILNNLNEFTTLNIDDLRFTGTIEVVGLVYEIG